MNDSHDVTRRDFLVSSAMITASSALGGATPMLGAVLGQEPASAGTVIMPATEVNMGSVFPAGGVYFRKSNPPGRSGHAITKQRTRSA